MNDEGLGVMVRCSGVYVVNVVKALYGTVKDPVHFSFLQRKSSKGGRQISWSAV
jgi:hypothetical protein